MTREPIMPDPAPSRRWLSIVGIGEDGVEGLSRGARALIASAEIVFGGARHLSLARPLIKGQSKPWPSPFSLAVGEVLGMRGRQICVLASGNPFFYGVGATLAVSFSLTGPASAQQVCLTRDDAAKALSNRFEEVVVGRGLANSGRAMFELFLSEKGSWTVVVSDPSGRSCIVASGENWQQLQQLVGDPA